MTSRVLGTLGLIALLVLHVDAWREPDPTLHLGWLPTELLWRLGWMALAFLYLLYSCARLWPDEERDA